MIGRVKLACTTQNFEYFIYNGAYITSQLLRETSFLLDQNLNYLNCYHEDGEKTLTDSSSHLWKSSHYSQHRRRWHSGSYSFHYPRLPRISTSGKLFIVKINLLSLLCQKLYLVAKMLDSSPPNNFPSQPLSVLTVTGSNNIIMAKVIASSNEDATLFIYISTRFSKCKMLVLILQIFA